MKRFFSLFIALTCLAAAAFAQQIPVNPKFGSVSDREIDIREYAPDTSATAVLLYRSIEVVIGFDIFLELGRTVVVHDRWKILKEEGRDVANYQRIYVNAPNERERVSEIKVVTYNRDNGSVRQTKMSRKNVFDEKYADRLNRISFTAEDVRVGSVVEVSYKIESPSLQIEDIYLQSSAYPVNQIDVDVAYAEYFYYNTALRGTWPCQRSRKSINDAVTTSSGAQLAYTLYHDCFSAVDVPVLRKEPHSFCPDQYRLSVIYDLRSIVIPGVASRHFNTDWKDVDLAFSESELMRQIKLRQRDLAPLQARLSGLETEDEKLAAVWSYVGSLVKWNGDTDLFPEEIKQVVKKGEGSSADINALMASYLNSLGYTAEPVLVKPRSQGVMVDFHIAASSFRTFILRVTAPDGSVRYLDASDRDGWFNVLGPDYLVSKARVLHLDGHGEWVDLSGCYPVPSIKESVKMTPDPKTGRLAGSVQIEATGQIARSVRAHYHSFSSQEDWIEETENDEGIEVLEMDFEDPDQRGEKARIRYSFEMDCDASGDFLFIKPFLSQWHDESSFREEERKLPVEFPYPEKITYVCVIDVPEGYAIEQLPENIRVETSRPGQGSFSLQCQPIGGQIIQLSFRSSIDAKPFGQSDYANFRAFWETLCQAEKSVITLKKE